MKSKDNCYRGRIQNAGLKWRDAFSARRSSSPSVEHFSALTFLEGLELAGNEGRYDITGDDNQYITPPAHIVFCSIVPKLITC